MPAQLNWPAIFLAFFLGTLLGSLVFLALLLWVVLKGRGASASSLSSTTAPLTATDGQRQMDRCGSEQFKPSCCTDALVQAISVSCDGAVDVEVRSTYSDIIYAI